MLDSRDVFDQSVNFIDQLQWNLRHINVYLQIGSIYVDLYSVNQDGPELIFEIQPTAAAPLSWDKLRGYVQIYPVKSIYIDIDQDRYMISNIVPKVERDPKRGGNYANCLIYNLEIVSKLGPIDPWIGFDLDGVLAYYERGYAGKNIIGPPIEKIWEIVKDLINKGKKVKIFTARVHQDYKSRELIKNWLATHNLPDLEITNIKDHGMIALFDDRAISVEQNTGTILCIPNNILTI